jgi:hypothetical protein
MEEIFYTGTAISSSLYFVAGARLFRLGMRTGETPEYLLGTVFLLWSLFYYLGILPYVLVDQSMSTPLFFAGRAVVLAATIIFAYFTRWVFRSQDAWSGWLIAGTVLCLIVGLGGSVAIGDWGGVQPLFNPWYWLEALGTTAPFVWMAAESLGQYGKAKRRLRLNFCEPLVCNRYLLMGLASVMWVAVEFVAAAQNIEYELTQQLSAPMDYLLMTTELISVSMVWLVFFPPAVYRRWIQRAAPAAAAICRTESSPLPTDTDSSSDLDGIFRRLGGD